MLDESFLPRLSQGVTASADARDRMRGRVLSRIEPRPLRSLIADTSPSPEAGRSLRERILAAIRLPLASDLRELVAGVSPRPERTIALRDSVLQRLTPVMALSRFQVAIRWGAAFALFLLLVRAVPLVFLAPSLQAEAGAQLIPTGDVSVFVNGLWQTVDATWVLEAPVIVRTGETARATLILGDDGVLRLGPDTTLRIHSLDDHHANTGSSGPMATLVRGKMWVLGLLPPVLDGISIEAREGILSLNSGSASLEEDGKTSYVQVFDRGATFERGKQVAFLVSGERLIAHGTTALSIGSFGNAELYTPWVTQNLSLDGVHRDEIAKMLSDRRQERAGILPTSFLYPAKRLAEEVDVLFTLSDDGKAEKRIQQADTRLNEAIALLRGGQNTEASVPLTEYRDSLIALAGGTGDNLVRFLVRKHVVDASSTLTQDDPTAAAASVRDAVLQVSAAIPDTTLKTRDIEGYVLVDTLAEINRSLSDHEYTTGLTRYAEIRPYLKTILADDGAHPLLKKEARSLLATTAKLVAVAPKDDVTVAAATDIAQYVPAELPSISDAELDQRIAAIVERIFVFRHPRSRYNQLLVEMDKLQGDPNRGTLLRRLKSALPEGLGAYVNTEIQKLGDELKGEGR